VTGYNQGPHSVKIAMAVGPMKTLFKERHRNAQWKQRIRRFFFAKENVEVNAGETSLFEINL